MPIHFDVILVATYDCINMSNNEIDEADQEVINTMMLAGLRLLDRDQRADVRCLTFEKESSHARVPQDPDRMATRPHYFS